MTPGPAEPRFRRPLFDLLRGRLEEPRRFIQVLAGPRQVGKSTLARQLVAGTALSSHYASADAPGLPGAEWVEQQWQTALASVGRRPGLLVLDEVHKVQNWSESVKGLWDEDTAAGRKLRVLLLGSSPLLVQRGLTESLAGRFEVIPCPHWSFEEMRDAFGWSLDRFVFFGAYPGAAPIARDEDRWRRYVTDSLVETTISRDILLLTRVDKPALLRQLFQLACTHSGLVVSYTKMLGQLHDAGNTTTLAHYLNLLSGAGFVAGLQKFSAGRLRQRASSPKLVVFNTALVSAQAGLSLAEARSDPEWWGRLIETAVGAHLLNEARRAGFELHYWREGNLEVDFVLSRGRKLAAVEVKTGRKREALPGMAEFRTRYPHARALLVGKHGIPVQEFLLTQADTWL